MGFKDDLKGKVFSRLTVQSYFGSLNKQGTWLCVCECGNRTVVRRNDIVRGHTKSCGCLPVGRIVHGDSYTKEFRAWCALKKRCNDKNNPAYQHYGGRGITVCKRWLECYENFLADMGRAPSAKHSIERIKNNRGYSPLNCKWGTPMEQVNNRRTTKRIKYMNKTQSLANWCRELMINYNKINMRLWNGWAIERAFETK